jgi:hypothetical protein
MGRWFRPGTIYCLRVRRGWRVKRGYIGKTRYRDYRKRVNEHFYGCWYGGKWNPPKYWAHEVVDYYPVWQGNWTDWGLGFREFLCIRVFFPVHNVVLNQGNPRRVVPPPVWSRVYPEPGQIRAVERYPGRGAPWDRSRAARGVPEMRARVRRDGTVERSGRPFVPAPAVLGGTSLYSAPQDHRAVSSAPRAVSAVVVLSVVGVLFFPGMPGWVAALAVWAWVREWAGPVGTLLAVVGLAGLFTTRKPRRRKPSRPVMRRRHR